MRYSDNLAPRRNTAGRTATAPAALGPRSIRRGATLLGCAAALTVAVLTPAVARAAPDDMTSPAGVVASSTAPVAAETDGLDPLLAFAYRLAQGEAQAQGVPLWIVSGYRTPAEQEALWEDGIRTYGSPDAARRWVLPPNESTHVSGQAIDVGPREGAAWLEANGNRWGLCRMYDNEWWHFELATVPGFGCPARLPDASQR